MRPENYPVWLEVLIWVICFALAAIPAYVNHQARRRSLTDKRI